MLDTSGFLTELGDEGFRDKLTELSLEDLYLLRWQLEWRKMARRKQLPPRDDSWDFYGVKSGRGFGKTLSAANWLGQEAARDPGSYNFVVAPTHEDLMKYCFNGPTGLLAVIPPILIKSWKQSPYPVITLWNDSIIMGFSADVPNRLRGPQCHRAWCFAAGTKIQTSNGEKNIEDIHIGDQVWTRSGLRRVLRAGLSNPNADLWELQTRGGHSLVGTANHPIWSESRKRFVDLHLLQPGDILRLCPQNLKTGKYTDTPTVGRFIAGEIDGGTLRRGIGKIAGAVPCIRRFTESIRERSRRVSKSIIGTKILLTMIHRIWWPSLIQLIESCIREGSLSGRALVDPKRFLLSGKNGNQELSFALPVEKISNPQDNEPNSVLPPVSKKTFTNDIPVTKVHTVKRLGYCEPVYDLTVEGEHEFFANDILVHNCDEVAAWRYPEEAWSNLIFGLRLGQHPQIFWTGTPKPKPFIRNLVKEPRSIVVSGSTYENRENLPDVTFRNIAKYEGTAIGRQEIWGDVIDPEEAGFVKRSDWRIWPYGKPLPKFRFIVMSLDTAFTEKTWNKKDQKRDPTACTVWGLFEHERKEHVMLLDAWEDHLGFPALLRRVKDERQMTYGDSDEPIIRPALLNKGNRPKHQGRSPDAILIEEKGSGISLLQSLAVEQILAHPYNPGDLDKLSRLHASSPLFPHGRVWAIESRIARGMPRTWAEPVISQVCTYVGEGSLEHDDLLDTATQALLFLMHKFNITFTVRTSSDGKSAAALEHLKRDRRRNPYDGKGH